MRVLLDENLPHDLIAALVGHSVSTVQGLGWAGTQNGRLLKLAGGATDAFMTMDGKLEHQHDISVLPFGVVVVGAPSNRMPDLYAARTENADGAGKGSTGQGRARWSHPRVSRPLERNLKRCALSGPFRAETSRRSAPNSQENRRNRRPATSPAAFLSHGTGVRIPVQRRSTLAAVGSGRDDATPEAIPAESNGWCWCKGLHRGSCHRW